MSFLRLSGPSANARRYLVSLLWLLVLASIPLVTHFDQPAWDIGVYRHAMESLRAGHDPYADAIALQVAAHQRAPNTPSILGPFSYVYSPITLPLLGLFARMPLLGAGILYGFLYVAGIAALTWFGLSLMDDSERRVLGFYAPAAIFFPGLLGSDSVMSGNVAYILYGAVLLALSRAVKTGRWRWFYVAVLVASCFKAPLLSLLAIPVLCARRQWPPAIGTAAAGLALFAVQPLVWPRLFHNYLTAVSLQFSFNRDFGFSPAGLLSGWLFDHRLPYSPAAMIFYVAYAIPLFGALVYLSRRYLRGDLSAREWLPVMLTGVILLNPRLIEYDAAPLALPLAILCWRFFSRRHGFAGTLLRAGGVFLILNLLAVSTWNLWKLTEGPLLVVFFAGGALRLLRASVPAQRELAVPAVLTQA